MSDLSPQKYLQNKDMGYAKKSCSNHEREKCSKHKKVRKKDRPCPKERRKRREMESCKKEFQ
jgi:hypothetical protein